MSAKKSTATKTAAKSAKLDAAKAEVVGAETAEIEWTPPRERDLDDPRVFRFVLASKVEDWPVSVTEAFEDGKAATASRALLGPDQWDEFKAINPSNRDLNDLFEHIARKLGFESAGESSASSA